jgi:pimeloyl-ACP methyl ester carboxylesterase
MIESFPANFNIQEIALDGVTIHTRVGGTGPAVLLLHGFADTGDMWTPLAGTLARTSTVVVPDLRGMGLSSQPKGGYDKKTQGRDMAHLLDALKIDTAALVTHDIGNMLGYALAAQFPEKITRWIVMDAPLPGIGPWDEILKSPMLWHFNFRGPDMERLVAGRERIYLDRHRSTRRRATTMRRSTPGRATCTARSSSLLLSARTRRTTRRSPQRASSRCRCWRSARTSRSAPPKPTCCASSPATSRARSSPIPATG